MNTVRLTTVSKLKQGDLWSVMKDRGWSQNELGRQLGIRSEQIGALINCKTSNNQFPKTESGWERLWTDDRTRTLLELTGKLPDELWPKWLRDAKFKTDCERTIEVSSHMLDASETLALPETQTDHVMRMETEKQIADALRNTLTPKQERVIRLRFGFDGEERTLEDVAREMNTSRERVRQIEITALRKMDKRMCDQREIYAL